MTDNGKKRVFIGSSSESLDIAYAIQSNLEMDTNPTVWNQGIFQLTHSALDSLTQALEDFDAGIFVFCPDDVINFRNNEYSSVRDNVIFELGLFIGKLGIKNSFFVIPRVAIKFKLPSDLDGIVAATYDPNRYDGNLNAALAPACQDILQALKTQEKKKQNNLIYISNNREEHYNLAVDMITNAKKRIYLIERTPVLLLGPDHYRYEKNYYNALNKFMNSTLLYDDRELHSMFITEYTQNEIISNDLQEEFIENLTTSKNLEKETEGRFTITSLPVYYGSFLVCDSSCAIWFKGRDNAISVKIKDDLDMSDVMIEIYHRLMNGKAKSLEIILNEIELNHNVLE